MALKDFRVLVYDDFNSGIVIDDLTAGLVRGFYSTQLHGGLGLAQFQSVQFTNRVWQYLQGAAQGGFHFAHIEVWEGPHWRWEGRIMDIVIEGQGQQISLVVTAYGYYSSLRDIHLPLTPSDTFEFGTNPTSAINTILDAGAPSLNTSREGIVQIDDVIPTASIDFNSRKYPQELIVKSIAPLGDAEGSTYYFSVGQNRIAKYFKRSLEEINWQVRLADMNNWRISQSVKTARKTIGVYDGSSLFVQKSNPNWGRNWPERTETIQIPTNATLQTATQVAEKASMAKGKVQISNTGFKIGGNLQAIGRNETFGSKSAIKAGDVMQITDLFGLGSLEQRLESLRTIYVGYTRYDLGDDTVEVEPDDVPQSADILLARLEADSAAGF